MFTVTSSLKALVPSLFWARTLNWYAVSGSRASTSSQLGPGGTGRDSQSWGPNCARFILPERERIGDKGVGWVTLETQEGTQVLELGVLPQPPQVRGQEQVTTPQLWLCRSP